MIGSTKNGEYARTVEILMEMTGKSKKRGCIYAVLFT